MSDETDAWLHKAEEDRLAASCLLHGEAPLALPAAFHIQQSA